MPKTKISEFSATPANNTDIDSINIAEGCAPSGINDAIRELMAQLKDFQTGAVGDSFNGPVGSSTAAAGAFTTLSASSTATLSGLTASTALALDASKNIVSVTNTGTGSNVLATSPTLVTPVLGTPTSATLTNATGLPISTGVSGLGTGVATFLATPSSANLAAALTDETGSGANVFATSPTLVTPILGTPTSATLTNATGLPLTTGVTGVLPTANGGTNLSSFTSGGVVYASSTSALATSSNLTYNGTSTLTITNGNASLASSGNLYLDAAAGSSVNLRVSGYSASVQVLSTSVPVFSVGSAEGMRLTSTGLGIGTSSPAAKLNISGTTSGNSVLLNGSGTGANFARISSTGADGVLGVEGSTPSILTGSLAYATLLYTVSTFATALQFGTNSVARVTIDTSGNVGIGTSSPSTRLHVKSADNTTASVIVENLNNTNGILQFGSASSSYQIFGGAYQGQMTYNTGAGTPHIFWIGGSEQMRLTSTGLGIGTSSPNASAILDAQSTTKGVRMPNMTTTQKNAISSPAAGLMVFDTTLAKLCVYSGSAWQTITSI